MQKPDGSLMPRPPVVLEQEDPPLYVFLDLIIMCFVSNMKSTNYHFYFSISDSEDDAELTAARRHMIDTISPV